MSTFHFTMRICARRLRSSARVAQLSVLLAATACDATMATMDEDADSSADAGHGARLLSSTAVRETAFESGSTAVYGCPRAADARVRDLVIESVAIGGKPMNVRIILPRHFEEAPSTRWPVLYLLPGHGSSYEAWTCRTEVRALVEDLDLLVVMPDGTVGYDDNVGSYRPDELSGLGSASSGVPGWYSDWQEDTVAITNGSGLAPEVRMRLRTHHTEELRDILNQRFRADNARYAVAGLSMGGYGALAYALASSTERPWVAAASFSGLLDTELVATNLPSLGTVRAADIVRGSIELAQAAQGELLLTGDRLWAGTTSQTWRDHNPTHLVAQSGHALKSMPLYVSAGQGSSASELDLTARQADGSIDPLEVGAYLSTRSFLAALDRADTDLTTEFDVRGKHDWTHWNVDLCHALASTLLPALGVEHSPAFRDACAGL